MKPGRLAELLERWADRGYDLRRAGRNLLRRPTLTAVVVVTIGLCAGANGTVFSVVRSVLLRPLPFPEPDRLVRLYNSYPQAGNPRSGNSVPDLYDRRRHVPALEEVALYTRTSHVLDGAGAARRTPALAVTPGFFSVLGTAPAVGRAFTLDPDGSRGLREVVLGHALWQAALGGDPEVVGDPLRLDGEPYTVVGILPEGFRFSSWDAQLFTTLTFSPKQRSDEARHRDWYDMLGRLAPGATAERAQDEIEALNGALLAEHPAPLQAELNEAGFTTRVRPYLADLTRDVRRPLLLLWGGVLVVFLIGGVNVASLFLIRARARSRELAARVALGAKRSRVLRELVAESSLAALAGAVLGLLLTRWSLGLTSLLEVYGVPRLYEVSADGTVMAVTVLGAAALGVVAGAVPVLLVLRHQDLALLQGRPAHTERGSSSMHRGLVSGQVALTFVLVMSAALLVDSLRNLIAVDPGFEPEGVSVAALTLPDDRYPDEGTRLGFALRMLATLETIPGLRAIAVADGLPFSGGTPRIPVVAEGGESDPGESLGAPFQAVVSPAYFEALGIDLVTGRGFLPGDDGAAPRVAIIDQTLARRLWPRTDPVGRRMWRGETADGARDPGRAVVVVGVVESVRHESLRDAEPAGSFYLPLAQHPLGSFRLATRYDGEPAALRQTLGARVATLDPGLALGAITPLEEDLADSLVLERTPMQLLSAFALLGLFLGALGVHGVVGSAVAGRTKEIGIRMAVGGTRWRIASLVARECGTMVGAGVVMGLLGVHASTSLFQSILYGTDASDPAVTAGSVGMILAAAAAACIVPIRRAVRVEPVSVLSAD